MNLLPGKTRSASITKAIGKQLFLSLSSSTKHRKTAKFVVDLGVEPMSDLKIESTSKPQQARYIRSPIVKGPVGEPRKLGEVIPTVWLEIFTTPSKLPHLVR